MVFDRPLPACMRHRAGFWAKCLFGASLRCFKATSGFQLSWKCQCWPNWSSSKSDCIDVVCKTNGGFCNTPWSGRQLGVLITSHLPETKEESRNATMGLIRYKQLSAGGWSPQVIILLTCIAALHQKGLLRCKHCCKHRAKVCHKAKVKPGAITLVQLSFFYWLCYSINSGVMQPWMEPGWLSPA